MIYSYNTIKNELKTFTCEVKGNDRTICGYYTRERVHPASVPEGTFMYECRHSDYVMFGEPITISEELKQIVGCEYIPELKLVVFIKGLVKKYAKCPYIRIL